MQRLFCDIEAPLISSPAGRACFDVIESTFDGKPWSDALLATVEKRDYEGMQWLLIEKKLSPNYDQGMGFSYLPLTLEFDFVVLCSRTCYDCCNSGFESPSASATS